MKCPECGQSNPQNPRYCTRCGHQLGSVAGGSPSPTPAVRGQPRKTQAEEGLFSTAQASPSGAAPNKAPASPPASRSTKLDEGDDAEARVVGWMVAFQASGASHSFVLRAGRNRMGRGRDNDISLFFEPRASDTHATLIWRSGRAAVKDEGSSNGTYVNGRDLGIGESGQLQSGDVLRIGGTKFLVFLIDPDRARETWPKSPWGR